MIEEFKIRSYSGITFISSGTILCVIGIASYAKYVNNNLPPFLLTIAICFMITLVSLVLSYMLSSCEISIKAYKDHLSYSWTKHPIFPTKKEVDIKYQDILEFKYVKGPSSSFFYLLIIKLKTGDTIDIRTDSTWTNDFKATDSFAKFLKKRKVRGTGYLASLLEIDD